MSLTFNELKQLIFDNVIDQASIIANHIGAKIILTGSDEKAKMYVYDDTTISYKKVINLMTWYWQLYQD